MKIPQSDWENHYRSGNTPWRTSDGLENWLEIAGVDSGEVLDLGCGSGDQAIWLARHGFNVEALDYSAEALAIAKAAAQEANVGVKFFQWDFEDLTSYHFLQEKYDLIICKKVVAFLNNQNQFLQVASEHLRGVMILQVFLEHDEAEIIVSPEADLSPLIEKFFQIKQQVLSSPREGVKVADYYLIPKV